MKLKIYTVTFNDGGWYSSGGRPSETVVAESKEQAIEKAFEKAQPNSKVRYTHPNYGITVVGKKLGINGFELITCWQKDEDAEC